MVVRLSVRFPWRHKAQKAGRRRLARTVSSWLTPASVASSFFAFWCLAADLELTGKLGLFRGPFARWQIWLASAVLLQILASRLNRYGRGDGAAMP